MSFLEGALHTTILGGTQIAAASGSIVHYHQADEHEHSREPLFDNVRIQAGRHLARNELSAAAAYTALHDSAARSNAPRCHRNTRVKYLDKLERWMLGNEEEFEGKRLIWINGGAGAGKSAIMQSIVERCARHAVILGSFFFSRTDPLRNYAEVLIPTLAYQLARTFPAAMAVLEPIISCDPLIFKASLHTQAYELLVRPLLHLVDIGLIDNTGSRRKVFVIDGLDECSEPQKQALAVDVVASILCDYHLPIIFLIASRPEVSISSAFQREKRLYLIFASICLNGDDEAESDIREFIVDSFLDIIENHPLRHHITMPWPDLRSIDNLVWKSSGHFTYAATAMKFIASSDEHPPRALEVIEGLAPSRTTSPFAELDALYMHILTSAKYSSQVLQILRHCYLTNFQRSVAAVCRIHDISPEDVSLYLSDVQSLISLSPNNTPELIINLRHASLVDFLADKERSQALYITYQEYYASFLARYFQLVDEGPQTPTSPFCFQRPDTLYLISYLADAILYSQNTNLLQSLIHGHSPQVIWNFWAESCTPNITISSNYVGDINNLIGEYMRAIRDSEAVRDYTLYIHQFKMYIQLLMDGLNESIHKKPQYRIILALIFSSSASNLILERDLLFYFDRQFHIDTSYRYHFNSLQGNTDGVVDPQSFKAIRCLPQIQNSWGCDLAILAGLVFRQLLRLSMSSGMPFYSPHRQWLQRHKPRKQKSLGSPKLSSIFPSLLMRPGERNGTAPFDWNPSRPYRPFRWRAWRIYQRRMKCRTLLKTVIFYLHKSDCTSEVVKLARKSLPKAAFMFPKMMKRARAAMDAYIRRWEDSPDGLLEKAQSLSLDEMD